MQIIISEKSIAGERIASLLADGEIKQLSFNGARVFNFNWKGEEIKLIPLRGHISNVEFPKEYSSWQKVALKDLVNAPILYSMKEYKIINAITQISQDAEKIIIATDADREGESIGLEALNYAKKTNNGIKIARAYFSAITKEEINKTFDDLEKFDYNFAYSANSRREIDLIWGAVLTRFISLATGQLGKNFLSVGRVQTPTLALVVDREKERNKFQKKKYWELSVTCKKEKTFTAGHKEGKFWEEEKVQKILDKNISELDVKKVKKQQKTLKKPVPFNTTEFLRAATNIGLSAGKAMSLAETLYQKGFVSYPRTDNKAYPKSLDLKQILNRLVTIDEFKQDVVKVLSQEKIIPSKGKSTKDHPPIHPVMPVKKNVLNNDEWKVYELICRRFLATLYEAAITENLIVLMEGKNEQFVSRGQVIIKQGWKGIYFYSKLKETILPPLKEGDCVKVLEMKSDAKETQPPNRYSQGGLIKLMEKHNLGTKSTRPSIIQKLYSRGYIAGNKSIEASDIAISVIDSLEKYCEIVVNPKMTAQLEEEMDEIAAGKKDMKNVVKDSSKKLEEIVEILENEKDKIRLDVRKSVSNSNVLGDCEKCKGQLVIRKGKSGKRFVGCNSYPECTNSYPLPQKGKIIPVNEKCHGKNCSAPVIKVINKKFNYKMCIDMNCETKKSWKKYTKK